MPTPTIYEQLKQQQENERLEKMNNWQRLDEYRRAMQKLDAENGIQYRQSFRCSIGMHDLTDDVPGKRIDIGRDTYFRCRRCGAILTHVPPM